MTDPSLSLPALTPTCPDTSALIRNITAALSTTLADLESRVNATTATLQANLDHNVNSLVATFDRIFVLLIVLVALSSANLLLSAIGHALVLSTACRGSSAAPPAALVAT